MAPNDDDLFDIATAPRPHRVCRGNEPAELRAARALCRRLKRAPSRHEKQKVAHLICENLRALLMKGR